MYIENISFRIKRHCSILIGFVIPIKLKIFQQIHVIYVCQTLFSLLEFLLFPLEICIAYQQDFSTFWKSIIIQYASDTISTKNTLAVCEGV